MDKAFVDGKQERVEVGKCERGGISLVLSTLACICAAFTLLNLSLNTYSSEEKRGELSEAVIAMTRKMEESEAVSAFLGIDGECEEEY